MDNPRHLDIDTHGQPPAAITGTLDEALLNLPRHAHSAEPLTALTQEEIDQQWAEGLEEERAQMDADQMHRRAQTAQRISDTLRGTNTALQSNGFYATGSNLNVGKFLPGFGPVTYSNHEKADAFARELNRQKRRQHR